jgi:hypothetical protein
VENKWKHHRDNFCSDLNSMNVNKSRYPGSSPSKRMSQWRWFKLLLFLKVVLKARSLENNLQYHSVQLDWESTDFAEDSYVSTYSDFFAEFSSDENPIHSKEQGLEIESTHWKKR